MADYGARMADREGLICLDVLDLLFKRKILSRLRTLAIIRCYRLLLFIVHRHPTRLELFE